MEEKHKIELDVESIVPTESYNDPKSELPTEDAQQGVKDVEAVTLTWSKTTLIAVFIKYVLISHTTNDILTYSAIVFGFSILSMPCNLLFSTI